MYTFKHIQKPLKAFIGVFFLAAMLWSCEKHVTPNKVSKRISEDSWVVSSFIYFDSNVVTDYTNKLFGFGESGNIIIQSDPGNTGHWSVGLNKKPTVLYITSFLNHPFTRFNDDWGVLTCSKTKITLSSENGSFTNSITLIKDED